MTLAAEDSTALMDGLVRQILRQFPELAEDEELLSLLREVPRERYADRYAVMGAPRFKSFDASPQQSKEVWSDAPLVLAYDNVGLPVSTISAPSIVLKFISLLDLQPGHHVTEIGSGCGWMAAMMARRVGTEGIVHGIEILPEVARAAAARQARIGPRNLVLHEGDFNDVLPGLPPQDRIVATAAFDRVPRVMLDALSPEGVLLLPVTMAHAVNASLMLNRSGQVMSQLPTLFVPASGVFSVAALLPDWRDATRLSHPGPRSETLSARIARLPDPGFGLRSFVAATEDTGFFTRRPDPATGKPTPGWAYGTTYPGGAVTITDRDGVLVQGSAEAASAELDRLIARWTAVLRPAPGDLSIRTGEPTADGTALSLTATVRTS
ncbi:hypothetical protein [uncultured Roseobacter sp.]|uniref:protein-L-isoaspartate O-methyltransferase family protein n=1 Tax=uncultured Roseobacter sp. TaxID=114847 RepID=UPI00261D8A88|nr:hypothetical protein [uncultured Roseobacter sp.]